MPDASGSGDVSFYSVFTADRESLLAHMPQDVLHDEDITVIVGILNITCVLLRSCGQCDLMLPVSCADLNQRIPSTRTQRQ